MNLFINREHHGHNVHDQYRDERDGGLNRSGGRTVHIRFGRASDHLRVSRSRLRRVGDQVRHWSHQENQTQIVSGFLTGIAVIAGLLFSFPASASLYDGWHNVGAQYGAYGRIAYVDNIGTHHYGAVAYYFVPTSTVRICDFVFEATQKNGSPTKTYSVTVKEGGTTPDDGTTIIQYNLGVPTTTQAYYKSIPSCLTTNKKVWFLFDADPSTDVNNPYYGVGVHDNPSDAGGVWQYYDGSWTNLNKIPFLALNYSGAVISEISAETALATQDPTKWHGATVVPTSTYTPSDSLGSVLPTVGWGSTTGSINSTTGTFETHINAMVGNATNTFPMCLFFPFFTLVDLFEGQTFVDQQSQSIVFGNVLGNTSTLSLAGFPAVMASTGVKSVYDIIVPFLEAIMWLGLGVYVFNDLFVKKKPDEHE